MPTVCPFFLPFPPLSFANLLFPTVRQKAKDITNLLLDEKRMKTQRATRKDMRNRMAGERGDDDRRERPSRASPPAGADSDLQRAIEASKRSAEDEGRRHKDEDDLEKAMRLSREDEERRQRELAANGGGGLFDDQQQQYAFLRRFLPFLAAELTKTPRAETTVSSTWTLRFSSLSRRDGRASTRTRRSNRRRWRSTCDSSS